MDSKPTFLFSKKVRAHSVFFPVAAIYAVTAIPVSLYARYSGSTLFPGLNGLYHGHEMLFGFALALVAGYLLGSISKIRLLLLFGIWLIARISYMTTPGSLVADLSSPLFALLLAWWVAPKFLVAKKWRNQMLTPLLTVICIFPLAFPIVDHFLNAVALRTLMAQAVLLLALLMSYMGGRMIAPAVGGELYKQGIDLGARVQPRIEGTIILLLPASVMLLFVSSFQVLSGVLAMITGCLLIVRLARWQLWRCGHRPDLIGLGIGYGWLAIGVFLYGLSLALNLYGTVALHVITVGAIGSLSTNIMLRVHFQRSRRQLPGTALVVITISGIAVATLLRVMAGLSTENTVLLMSLAAVAWCVAFLTVASQFLPSSTTKSSY